MYIHEIKSQRISSNCQIKLINVSCNTNEKIFSVSK